MDYDFSGWATRNNIKCSDGRTIMKNAFIECNGTTVPLVWNHDHKDATNVLGHAMLENRPDGVYAYGVFNNTPMGQHVKSLVEAGDINGLSIYANKLKERNGNVYHGQIRELSLVLATANPGAYIETVLTHGDDEDEDGYSAEIFMGPQDFELYHSEDGAGYVDEVDEEELDNTDWRAVFKTLNEKQKQLVYILLGAATEDEYDDGLEHSDKGAISDMYDINEVLDGMTEEQIEAVSALLDDAANEGYEAGYDDAYDEVDDAIAEDEEYADDGEYNDEDYDGEYDEGDGSVKHNAFDGDEYYYEDDGVLSHSEMKAVIDDAKSIGSLKESALQHGITDIDWLFPEARSLNNPPDWIKRDTDWVQKVMNAVHHTPFSRIKSQFADITGDEARAKGYTKGNRKMEEVFTLLKRTTTPTTVYKKQKLDRDDVIDITDFDVIAWLKTEMRMMLDEELARAFLVGDGRNGASDDKIKEDCIRPIWTDDDLYTIKYVLDDERPTTFIKGAIKSRVDYKGSGNPVLFITEDKLTDLLLITDSTGRDIYDSEQKLATKLRVSSIITVPVLRNLTRHDTKTGKNYKLHGLIVNLKDYNVGADKGGAVNMFDDFDIDYNAQKYLIETRCSGALIKPMSAIALETEVQGTVPPSANSSSNS